MSPIRILMLMFAALSAASLVAQEDPARTTENGVILDPIEAADIQKNLQTLQAILDRLPFRSTDPERYANMVYAAFDSLYQKGTVDMAKAHQLEQGYILSALDRPDMIPTEAEVRLVLKLRAKISSTGASTNAEEEVRKKMKLLFHAWRRMERDTDPTFSFNFLKMGVENLAPKGPGGISGTYPPDIPDMKVRDEYLAALEENRRTGENARTQIWLRNVKEPFLKHAEEFLVSAVRTGAVDESEVLSDLNLVQDQASRQRAEAKVQAARVR